MNFMAEYLSGRLDLVQDSYGLTLRVEDLDGRTARCSCGEMALSSVDLPYFEFRPTEDEDGYFCDECRGGR